MDSANIIPKKERVIVYVDGFNLYFGLQEAGFSNCKWLNINQLAKSILHINQELVEIKYFTSRVSNNPDKQKRQTTYIEALESVGIKIFYGHYQSDKTECRQCGNIWPTFHEKMTDVSFSKTYLTPLISTSSPPSGIFSTAAPIGEIVQTNFYSLVNDTVKFIHFDSLFIPQEKIE